MKALRRLALSALAIAFLQIVFGAVVRITNSGMGCGDHWPKCLGYWVPPMNRPDLVIEVTHRYLALLLFVPVLALLAVSWVRRGRQAGVAGPGGVLRPALLAIGLYALIANLGRIIVQFGLHPWIIAIHLVLAMSLLATLAAAAIRAGALGALAADRQKISAGTRRAAMAAAGLAILVVAMGALTANLPGAAAGCLGFPVCSQAYDPTNGAAHVQLTHRVLALLLLVHLGGLAFAVRRRGEVGAVTTAGQVALGLVVLQVVVAAVLVTTGLPRSLQSLHQAIGTLVWLATFVLAVLARRAALREPGQAEAPALGADARRDDPSGRVRTPSRPVRRAPDAAMVPATAAQATIAFVATTGPNARMVRVDPSDDAGFAAAEAGESEAFPPVEDPLPDVPALAETGSWSVADLAMRPPEGAGRAGDDERDDAKDDVVDDVVDDDDDDGRGDVARHAGGGPDAPRGAGREDTGGSSGTPSALAAPLAAPLVTAALLAARRPPSLAVIIARGAMS